MDNLNHQNLIGRQVKFTYGTSDIETISKVTPVPSKNKEGCYSEVFFETEQGTEFNYYHLKDGYVGLVETELEGLEQLYAPFDEVAA